MPGNSKRILNVVTNVRHYSGPSHPTGLWLSELTHAWNVFEEHGLERTIFSPRKRGGPADPTFMALLDNTASPNQIDSADFDAIFFTGGHGVM
ncbi:intracellular protease/amidase [Penicillium chrysogenum]|uniref:Intracellular protease/amidase n=1 Tax=Penicillium chrysogenum TaxID=5076 RepID=A0ABQ8WAP4_PENCH|nr:intracellular protease/amidase [Penicillium chrysogenum]